jgi:creatinine amidohydrolase/Fe(II)-dependent formamide hydrolase-like protein
VAVARRACAGRAGVALAPAFCVGASGEHADFPGTLSIGTEALTTCLIELGRHASLHWPALLLVNGHGGNTSAVEAAVGRLGGVLGDPSGASAAEGERLLAELTQGLVGEIDGLLDRQPG